MVGIARRYGRRLGAYALVAGCAALALVPAAGARTSRPPIRAHRHRFVPVTGDWEGSADGFPASFELTYEPGFSPPYALSDYVSVRPQSCPVGAEPDIAETLDGTGLASIGAGGSFELAKYDLYGGLTGTRAAKTWFNISYAVPVPASCPKRVTIALHPVAHRKAVDDGTWSLRFSDGETGTFKLTGGGRLSAVGIPNEVAHCYPMELSPPGGSFLLFIAPDGVATGGWPEQNISATLSFKQKSATGQLLVDNEACADIAFPMTATLVKKSR
jgi:hypothetical protein